MNFWDLCVACGRAIGRGCQAFGRLLAHMLRLTVRYWWIVLPVLGMFIGWGYYKTRYENTVYKVNAVVLLNGASIQQFEQAYAPLRTGLLLDENDAITPFIHKKIATNFDTYRVVDAKHDGIADYIDFKGNSSPTDTTRVQMTDRLCLQFRVKSKNLSAVPEIEKAVLELLNNNEAMQASFAAYRANLDQEVAFNHAQAVNLEKMAERYCTEASLQRSALKHEPREQVLTAESKVDLSFYEDIYDQQAHMQQVDYRQQLATAPVTLENHFGVDPKPLNARRQQLPKYILMGWILGCLIAQLIYKRKAICAWIKL